LYKYHFKFSDFEDSQYSRTVVRNKELNDAEIQNELNEIFKDVEGVKEAILEYVSKE
jgi:hypothetical protein